MAASPMHQAIRHAGTRAVHSETATACRVGGSTRGAAVEEHARAARMRAQRVSLPLCRPVYGEVESAAASRQQYWSDSAQALRRTMSQTMSIQRSVRYKCASSVSRLAKRYQRHKRSARHRQHGVVTRCLVRARWRRGVTPNQLNSGTRDSMVSSETRREQRNGGITGSSRVASRERRTSADARRCLSARCRQCRHCQNI